jgi:hypothetical protein
MRRRLTGCVWLALVLFAPLVIAGCDRDDGTVTDAPQSQPAEQSAAPAQTAAPAVDNPLPVGQAVDSVAAPAIAEVLGPAVLTRASDMEAFVVSLVYQAPAAAAEGDGQRLLDAFLGHGATADPERPGVESHYDAEQFSVLYDTGDPAFQTIRVSITPGSPDVYVNADKAQ